MKCPKQCLKDIVRHTVDTFDEEWAKVPPRQRLEIIADLIDGTSHLNRTRARLSRDKEQKRDRIVERVLRERYGE